MGAELFLILIAIPGPLLRGVVALDRALCMD